MTQKIICCIHDKKSDTFEGFMAYNNTNEALRSFQATCEQNETFKKWPEDFQMVLVAKISYENGEINENGEITKKGHFDKLTEYYTPIAEALDFVVKKAEEHAETPAED